MFVMGKVLVWGVILDVCVSRWLYSRGHFNDIKVSIVWYFVLVFDNILSLFEIMRRYIHEIMNSDASGSVSLDTLFDTRGILCNPYQVLDLFHGCAYDKTSIFLSCFCLSSYTYFLFELRRMFLPRGKEYLFILLEVDVRICVVRSWKQLLSCFDKFNYMAHSYAFCINLLFRLHLCALSQWILRDKTPHPIGPNSNKCYIIDLFQYCDSLL